MLNFFIILLTNVFTGIIIYLVLTIRLEKKTSSYEQSKIRREFEEVIRDFNASADRNITLLENRINIMKKLMKIGGTLESIDIESLDKLESTEKNSSHDNYAIIKDMPQKESTSPPEKGHYSFVVDEKIDLAQVRENESEETGERLQDILQARYHAGGEKHETLVSLYGEGNSVELLSESTGLSEAEIELILKLNGIYTNEGNTAHEL